MTVVKKWRRILALVLCLAMVQVPALPFDGAIVAEAAVKTGLYKEGNKYYFYSKVGNRVRNKWKTVNAVVGGETVRYRYYFGSNGAAYKGKVSGGIMKPAIKKIKGQYYGFDQFGRMLRGIYVKDQIFYAFRTDTGVLDTALTLALRSAAKEGAKFSDLTKLIKRQGVVLLKKQSGLDSCYGDGTDVICSYPGFDVQGFKSRTTKQKTVVNVVATAMQMSGIDPAAEETTETEDPAGETEDPTDETEEPQPQIQTGLKLVDGKYYFYNKKGETLKNRWKTIDNNRYYFTEDGSAQTYSKKINGILFLFDLKGRLARGTKSDFKAVGNKLYYVNANGQPYTGWLVINRALYYANKKGVLKRNKTTAGGITFDNTGKATNTDTANLKITTMEIIASITSTNMTKEQKLKACWDYVVANGTNNQHFSYYTRNPDMTQTGWQRHEALEMFNRRVGNCFGFACAFAALAKEIGYKPYVVVGRVTSNGNPRDNVGDGMTPHAWVMIDDKYYDPEADFKQWMTGVYGSTSYNIGHVEQSRVEF